MYTDNVFISLYIYIYISMKHSIACIWFYKICTLPSKSKYYICIFIDQSDLLPISVEETISHNGIYAGCNACF